MSEQTNEGAQEFVVNEGTEIQNAGQNDSGVHHASAQTTPGTPDIVQANPAFDDSTPDPDADATQNDDQAEQTDNSTTDADGDQSDVDQDPVEEDNVVGVVEVTDTSGNSDA